MKTGENNREFDTDLARYLCNEMDEAEKAAFEVQLSGSEEDVKMTGIMKEKWNAMEKYREPAPPDARKAWNKLHARLRDEDLIPAESRKQAGRFVPALLRVAAAIVILAGIASAFYFGFSRKNNVEMVQINTVREQNTLIKTLADGSVVYLAQNSEFSFPKNFENNSRHVELKGEAFFDITPDPGKPFTIETGDVIIEVLGTAFNVKTGNGSSFELVVDCGKVKVTLRDDPSVSETVTAGEMVKAVNNHVVKSKSSAAGSQAWYTKRMQFKDEPLQNILNVLNRNFHTTFVTANQEIGNRKLTVTFSGETPEIMSDLICQALKLKSQAKNGTIILSDNAIGPQDSNQ